jgi:hypothetical protein
MKIICMDCEVQIRETEDEPREEESHTLCPRCYEIRRLEVAQPVEGGRHDEPERICRMAS